MKKQAPLWIGVAFVAVGLSGLVGQQFTAQLGTGALTSCPTPVVGSNILCSVTDGLYSSNNGAAYVKINVQVNPPTKIACTTANINNTGLVASGCTLN